MAATIIAIAPETTPAMEQPCFFEAAQNASIAAIKLSPAMVVSDPIAQPLFT